MLCFCLILESIDGKKKKTDINCCYWEAEKNLICEEKRKFQKNYKKSNGSVERVKFIFEQ